MRVEFIGCLAMSRRDDSHLGMEIRVMHHRYTISNFCTQY